MAHAYGVLHAYSAHAYSTLTINVMHGTCTVCRDLTAALQSMLGVEDVWFWSQTQQTSEEFVLWADRVLEHR